MNDFPDRITVNLEVLMNKEIAHVGYAEPRYIVIGFLEYELDASCLYAALS